MNVYEQIRYLWEKSPQDFERRVQGWADNLEKKREEVKRNRSLFRAWKPLEVYVSYSFINSGVFSIRFFGQEVAKLKVVDGKKILIFGEKHVRHNEKYFKLKGFGVGKYPWEEATKFRKHFKQVEISDPCIRTGIEEHKLESLFLREMSKKSSENKFSGKLSEIQPVKVAGCPLQMPLPIGGSAGEPKPGHGHIDILARRRIRGTKVLLSVWELKDVNKLAQAVKQAYIYAVTLLLMLKSPSGQKWYKIFGFHGKLPKKLGVEAVVAVSRSEKAKVDKTIKETIHLMPLEIKEGTIDLFACVYDVTEPLDIDFRKIS